MSCWTLPHARGVSWTGAMSNSFSCNLESSSMGVTRRASLRKVTRALLLFLLECLTKHADWAQIALGVDGKVTRIAGSLMCCFARAVFPCYVRVCCWTQ
jgi:hypothetical protein